MKKCLNLTIFFHFSKNGIILDMFHSNIFIPHSLPKYIKIDKIISVSKKIKYNMLFSKVK